MTFDFRTLEEVPLPVLCDTFNLAFSDYIVPMHLTLPLLEQKLHAENIRLGYSIGAFDRDRLVGLILHGVDREPDPSVLYNGGTGVVPDCRGNRLVQAMYGHFLPAYRREGIRSIVLEVITKNTPAIKAYEHTGFSRARLYHCYKGNPATEKRNEQVTIIRDVQPDWDLYASFGNQRPSWSNTFAAIDREGASTITWKATLNGTVAGFISVYAPGRRIRQIAVAPAFRRQGIASALLQTVAAELEGPFSITNIDSENIAFQAFLQASGFEPSVDQYELSLDL